MPRPEAVSPVTPAAIEFAAGRPACVGDWTLAGSAGLDRRLAGVRWPAGDIQLDAARIQAIDTTGALWLLDLVADLERAGHAVHLHDLHPDYRDLLDLVRERRQSTAEPEPVRRRLGPVARLGRQTWHKLRRAQRFLAFLGEATVALGYALLRPDRIRWRPLVANIERAGLNAMPIVGLLSFLIGVVIAYQGGNQLRSYGANIFIVELVTLTMVRELAPLMTAIIVAGRTGSAYTAQIGTMQVTEEIDALRIIGINPFDILVLPKLLSLIIALPLLTVFADGMSILGGMVVAWLLLDVSFGDFLARIPQVVTLFSFLFGIGKTLVFAAVIALVGCYQGFQVRGGADSVGRQTTESVVLAIFLVIVVDALFAVFLGTKGLMLR